MKKGEEIELHIERLSGEGKTVARCEGMVVFVDHAVPGDVVRAKIWKMKKNYAEAATLEILVPSPLRVQPRCVHFGACGGCKWQDFSYEAQLSSKRQTVQDALHRIGGFEDANVLPVIGCDEPYFYRNKMEFTFSRRRWLTREEMESGSTGDERLALGLHIPQRYDKVLDLQECWLQSEITAPILDAVRTIARVWNLPVYSTNTHDGYLRHLVIRQARHTGDLMVNLVTTYDWPEAMENLTSLLLKQFPDITTIVNNITERKSMVAFGDSEKIYHGPGFINDTIGGYAFRISANSFFQTNTLQAEKLYATVKQFAGLTGKETVYDLYSGTGTIAIFLSAEAERVVCIEAVESAISDAERNTLANNISNCYFLQGDLKDRLTKQNDWLMEHPKPDVVVTDPPRSGMHPKVVQHLAALSPPRIVYVSCNPATQARDMRLMIDAGYRLGAVQPVDMFPHTDHVESVALLTLSPR